MLLAGVRLQIKEVEGNGNFLVGFAQRLGDPPMANESLPANSTRLAPLNSRTQRPLEQWRQELAANSPLDVLDTVNKWYTGKVLAVRDEEVLVTYDGMNVS